MTTVDEIARVTTALAVPRWPWLSLRIVTVLATLSAVAQAAMAGGVVAGRTPSAVGTLLLVLGTPALVAALVVAWRHGAGPAWLLVAGLFLLAATAAQLDLGSSRPPTFHAPLGTTLIVAQGMLMVWAWQRPVAARRP